MNVCNYFLVSFALITMIKNYSSWLPISYHREIWGLINYFFKVSEKKKIILTSAYIKLVIPIDSGVQWPILWSTLLFLQTPRICSKGFICLNSDPQLRSTTKLLATEFCGRLGITMVSLIHFSQMKGNDQVYAPWYYYRWYHYHFSDSFNSLISTYWLTQENHFICIVAKALNIKLWSTLIYKVYSVTL